MIFPLKVTSKLSRVIKNRLKGIHGPTTASIIPVMPRLIKHFQRRQISVIEIGARYGESSETILRSLDVREYIIIDPYQVYDEYKDDGFYDALEAKSGDTIFRETHNKLRKFHPNITFMRAFSDDETVLQSIADNSADLIFVDGNHNYDYVMMDLRSYYPKLKYGGILCGDDFHTRANENDYLHTLNEQDGHKQVFEAVEDFAAHNGLTYETYGSHRGYAKVFAFTKKRS
jgi:cephalosporin hydroxylase